MSDSASADLRETFSMLKDVVGRRSKTPTWACAETHHVGLCECRPARDVCNAQRCCRSAVEDPDMGLCRNHHVGLCECRPTRDVCNAQRCCRSAVEDPDMGLCPNPSCQTLRVPTYERRFQCLKLLQVGGRRPRHGPMPKPIMSDSASTDLRETFAMLKVVVGRRSKTPTWACTETHHVGLCECRPTR
jgi:hypothetical protein